MECCVVVCWLVCLVDRCARSGHSGSPRHRWEEVLHFAVFVCTASTSGRGSSERRIVSVAIASLPPENRSPRETHFTLFAFSMRENFYPHITVFVCCVFLGCFFIIRGCGVALGAMIASCFGSEIVIQLCAATSV